MSTELIIALATFGILIPLIINTFITAKSSAAIKSIKFVELPQIHELVNSRLSTALEEIATLRTYIAELIKNPENDQKAKKAIKDKQ